MHGVMIQCTQSNAYVRWVFLRSKKFRVGGRGGLGDGQIIHNGPSFTRLLYGSPLALPCPAYFLNIMHAAHQNSAALEILYICIVQPNNSIHTCMNGSLKLVNSVKTPPSRYHSVC